ncbi:MAG: hypothetical protein ACRDTM_13820 [Micromonosporaceae bacterium]
MADGATRWQLENFLERLDSWVARDAPSDDLRLIVTAWILTRYDDPYQGVRRESAFPNLWFGVVPNTADGLGTVVVCSYWIEEARRTVSCDNFGRLSLPL